MRQNRWGGFRHRSPPSSLVVLDEGRNVGGGREGENKTEKAIMELRMYPHEQAAGLETAQMREPTWPFLGPHYLNGEPSVLLGFLENLP